MNTNKKNNLNNEFFVQKVGKEITIFNIEKSVMFTLNRTASIIFQNFKNGWTEEKIAKYMTKKFDISEQEVKKDIKDLLETLKKKKILI